MKIQIDITNKTIKVEDQVNFEKLYELVSSLPENVFGKWQEYKIDANTKIVYEYKPLYWTSPYWYQGGSIKTYASADNSYNHVQGNTYIAQDKPSLSNNNIHNFQIS